MSRPIRVAVLGGGCAAIAAAFELTRPGHQGRYEVTVYQLGWRLGGKGASGRGSAGRIEEHGLHIWMGWYENAFRLMRECYAELGRDRRTCPIVDWRDGFLASPLVGVAELLPGDRWVPWAAVVPPTDGLPGDPPGPGQRWTVVDYMVRAVVLIRGLLETMQGRSTWQTPDSPGDGPTEDTDGAARAPIIDAIDRLLRYGELASLAGLVEGTALLQPAIAALPLYPQSLVLRFLDAIGRNAGALIAARLETEPALRRAWHVIDLTLATLRGAIRGGVMTDPRGFDALDEYDCREWLLLNGASEAAVDSGWMRALYDLGFSYEGGDVSRPRLAAGQALRGMVRTFFTYRGSFFWKMQAGMGDVVFAPFYEVLRRRGVRFEFFHRLRNVGLGGVVGQDRHVDTLEFDVQAEVLGGRQYEPLVDVQGLPCWPSTPDYGQLVDGSRLEHEGWRFECHWEQRRAFANTLRVNEDFDLVVLGVGLGAIPYVCSEIVAQDPRWRAMVDHVKTIGTQAFQLWLDADLPELGWTGGSIILAGFAPPFESWADMTHLVSREAWARAPRSLAYFCSVLPDLQLPEGGWNPPYPDVQREQVRRNAIRYLNQQVVHLWPLASETPGRFRWDLLAVPNGGEAARGEARFASQFWSANVNPSDRYVLSVPGSSAYRISPLDPTYDNLTVCGDWTSCGFNAGCVEAAMMSGRLAAHAIAKSPRLDEIVGYDHP